MTTAAFQSAVPDGRGWNIRFEHPSAVHAAFRLEDVEAVLASADRAAREGRWAAIAVAYEAAAAFEPAFGRPRRLPSGFPLAWAAIYEDTHAVRTAPNTTALGATAPRNSAAVATRDEVRDRPFRSSVDASVYADRVRAAQRHIRDGDIYQANVTFPMYADGISDPLGWYERLKEAQQAPYCAVLDIADFQVLSLSPELFFERRGDRMTLRPMKGTSRRGRTPEEDTQLADALVRSEKTRAENVMIVDLIRNDIGRVAEVGSVRVPALFVTEAYPTLWQLTSTVEAVVPPAIGLVDLFTALFPCGSVTGAPKIRAMRILAELEPDPRGLYTGAIGFIEPGGDCTFSVAIRTIVLHRRTGAATLGVGAGIVSGSSPEEDYRECLLKAEFASRR
jgi:para-aminobenzoate synthetase/4-amino-4-deoxychorismate lyase